MRYAERKNRRIHVFMYNQIENISQAIFKHAKLNIIIDYTAATLVYITMSNRAYIQ